MTSDAKEDERYYLSCPLRKNRARVSVLVCGKCRWAEWEEGWYQKERNKRKLICTVPGPTPGPTGGQK